MSGLDPDEDNVVRYGTQLEPFEEDHTSATPKRQRPKMSGAATRRFKKLLAANVNHEKARQLSNLWWSEICEIIPGLEEFPEENSPSNQPKRAKNMSGPQQMRSRKEMRRNDYRSKSNSDPKSYWYQPLKVRPTSQWEDNSRSYREGAGASKSRRGANREYEQPYADGSWNVQHRMINEFNGRSDWNLPYQANLHYGELERPTRIGLRNQTHPPRRSDNNYRDEYNWDQSYHRENTGSSRVRPHKNYDFDQPIQARIKTQKSLVFTNTKLSSQIQVRIKNVTPMTEEQMDMVQLSINKLIIDIGVPGGGPRFLGSFRKAGGIVVTCESKESKNWLEKEIPTLKPWPEAKLRCMKFNNELPKPNILQTLIPKSQNLNVEAALKLLRAQNKGLKGVNWKVLHSKKIEPGHLLSLAVNEQSFHALKRMNFKAKLGTSRIIFKLIKSAAFANSRMAKAGNASTAQRKGAPQMNTAKNKVKETDNQSTSVRSKRKRKVRKGKSDGVKKEEQRPPTPTDMSDWMPW